MATYTLSDGDRGAYAKTLVASTVDTVAFPDAVRTLRLAWDGTAAIYVTVDGTTPTVGGATDWELPSYGAGVLDIPSSALSGPTVVKLISSGTPTYSVSEA